MGETDPSSPYRSARRELPVLDNLRVAAPCDVSWDAMVGNGRVRNCAKCSKQVFNISAMTRADAQVFLMERAAGQCINFFRRADGTLITSDCAVGVRIRRRANAMVTFAVAIVAGLLGGGFASLGSSVKEQVGSASAGGGWTCDLPDHAPRPSVVTPQR